MLPTGVRPLNYKVDKAIIRTPLQWGLFVALIIILITLPLYGSRHLLGLANVIFITIIAVQGLNILIGYCGQISLGQAAFMAVGAYSSAILTINLNFPFWAALPCAALVTGIVGLFFGIPSLRIKGFYLALSTIAAQFIILFTIDHLPQYTGGVVGLHVPPAQIGNLVFDTENKFFYLALMIVVLMTYFSINLVRTRIGRAFIAIRDNDIAAEVMGVNLFYYKLLAFFICSIYAGVAGSLWAHYITVIHTEHFTFMNSIWYLGMIVIGGLGSNLGPIFGVIFVKVLVELSDLLNSLLMQAWPTVSAGLLSSTSMLIFGLAIAIFLIFEPRGLAHRWALFKTYYRLFPFSY
jgi:branched-chain amino acid transport system permease protein